jgi:hypothetical protein
MIRLIVVRRGEYACFERLIEELAMDPGVRVIWDRRVARRRRQQDRVSTERRHRERRALLAESWTALGCVVGGEGPARRIDDRVTA